MHQSRAVGAIQKVKPHVKGINFPQRKAWKPIIPAAGPVIPEHILSIASKPQVATKAAKASKKVSKAVSTAPTEQNVRGRKPRYVDIDVDNERANRATSLLSAKRTVPHQYTTVKVNLDQANQLCQKLEQTSGSPISMGDLVVRAASIALRKVPNANCAWESEELVPQSQLSLGLKRPTENGFEMEVLNKAAGTGVANINKRLIPLGNDNFIPMSIIDLQSTNVSEFTGLVEAENSILSIGGVDKALAASGEETQSMMVTLSADGRTLQMETALEVLDQLKTLLETPQTMFL